MGSLIIVPQPFVLAPAALGRGCLEKGCKDRVKAYDHSPIEYFPYSPGTEPDIIILLSTTPVGFVFLKFAFTFRTHIISACTASYVPAQA